MADYTSRTVISTRYEWIVPTREPWGAAYEEICKALAAAWTEYRETNGLPADAPQPGNFVRFRAGDDEILISFVIEEAVTDRGGRTR